MSRPKPSLAVDNTPRRKKETEVGLGTDHLSLDPAELYAPPPGKDSVVISFRVSHVHYAMMEEILASHQFDFRRPGDFARSAFVKFLEVDIIPRLARKEITSDMSVMAAQIRNLQRVRRLASAEKMAEELSGAVEILLRGGAIGEAVEAYTDMIQTVKKMDDPFRRIALEAVKRETRLDGVRVYLKKGEG